MGISKVSRVRSAKPGSPPAPVKGRRKAACAACFVLCLVFARPAYPQEIVTDRPGMGDGAGIVPTGTLQLEGGYRYSRVGPDKMHTLGEALLRVAPAEKLELRIGINSYLVSRSPGRDDSGFGDGSLGLKYKLLQTGEGMGAVDLSTILGTTLPTGSEIYRENKLQPWTQLILEWNINGDVVLAYNFYYGLASSEGDQYNTFGSGIAFSFPLADRLGCFMEYYGIAVEKGYGENTNYLDGGITWLLGDNLQVDMHSGAGLGTTDSNYFVGVGLSYNWGL